jgi:hypothetical protein
MSVTVAMSKSAAMLNEKNLLEVRRGMRFPPAFAC